MMVEGLVRQGERVDDLQRNGLKMIQDPSAFCFGMDAVLLADFTQIRPSDRCVADMGTGTGILPVLLSQKNSAVGFDAFEWQTNMADMAARTMRLNGLENRIRIHAMDMRAAHTVIGYESMDAVVCNPPYGKEGGVLLSKTEGISRARHEVECGIAEVVAACASVLKNLGRLSMVFPAARMLELCDVLRTKRLEPKRIRMVCAKAERAPYLVLVEAMKNARPTLTWLPPLIVYHADGSETEELKRIYHRNEGSDAAVASFD